MNVIITGASRGIGFELVKAFTGQSGNKVVAISRNVRELNSMAELLNEQSALSTLIPIPFDLVEIEKYEGLVQQISEHIKHVDILINNAGYLVNKPFETMLFQDLSRQYTVNVLGPYMLIQKLLLMLKKAKNAHVVNISSMGGVQGSAKFAGLTAYSSSKCALIGLTECMAEEMKHTTIKFNCLALGAVATEMLAEAFPGYQAQISAEQMAGYITEFAMKGHAIFNGKTIPVSLSTP